MDVNPYQAPAAVNPYGQPPYTERGDATVTPRAVEMLRQTQPWVRFLSILAFIAFGLLMLGAAAGLLFGLGSGRGEMAAIFVVYGLMGVLYLGPAVFLGRYAANIARLRASLRTQDLESALEAQKSFWRFAGIVALIVLVLYVLVFVVGFAGMAFFWRASRPPF